MHADELVRLFQDQESDRVERKESLAGTAKEKICQAICAFANDLPNHGQPGYVLVGVTDDGKPSGIPITDELLRTLAGIRADGNIQPLPRMNVQKHTWLGAEVAVVEVFPGDSPPVRYQGRTWIRVGPRRSVATAEEERWLTEKRIHQTLSFDRRPVRSATTEDLDLGMFRGEYLTRAVAPDILAENARSLEEQLASLRFLHPATSTPTVAGILVFGKDPDYYFPGAYVQFLRIEGSELTDPIKDAKAIRGTLLQQCRILDELLAINISTAVSIPERGPDIRTPDYPLAALQQLVRNALIHRSYEGTNAPTRVYWYNDRVDIMNPGGLYGQVHPGNFGTVTDYRNPQIAEAFHVMGFVQRFGVGIQLARKALHENGNPDPEFEFDPSFLRVVIRGRI